MPLNIKYETLEEASMRLQGTIVRYDGDPVYISNVTDGPDDDERYRVHIKDLPLHRRGDPDDIDGAKRKLINAAKFDLEPVPLGYVNIAGKGCQHVSRTPARKYKQGLSAGNVTWNLGKGIPPFVDFASLLSEQGFADMLRNKYPTINEAIETINKNAKLTSWAFHRDFAVMFNEQLGVVSLLHQCVSVGWHDDERFRISPQFKYLKEVLEKAKIPFRIRER